jgi:hypothetical protein
MRQINTALKYRYARKVAVIDRFEDNFMSEEMAGLYR